MNKYLLLILLALATLSFRKPSGYRVTGSIRGGIEGMKIYLRYAGTRDNKLVDSAILHRGHFTFSGKLSSPRLCTILFKDTARTDRWGQDRLINVFMENTDITVQAPYDSLAKEIDLYGFNSSGIVSAVNVKGSASHDFYLRYHAQAAPMDKEKDELFDRYIRYLNPEKGETQQPRTVGMKLCRRMDVVDSIGKAQTLQFIRNNPTNEVTAYIALETLRSSKITTTDIDWLMTQFAEAKEKGAITQQFLAEAPNVKRTAVGSTLVDFTMKDTTGKAYPLSQFIGKGKYVLLECWASWCHPCRADIPHLKEDYAAYHPYGFEVISVSLDEKKDNWTKALDQEKMPWLQLSDLEAFQGALPTSYHINGIPACLFFDPQGKLVTRNMRGSWMDNWLLSLYGDHFSDQARDPVHVTAEMADLAAMDSAQVYIHYHKDTIPATDTVIARKGKFSWQADLSEPQRVFMMLPNRYWEFFAGNGENIRISADTNAQELHVEGSKVQAEWDAYSATLKDLTDQEEALYPKWGKGTKDEQAALERQLTDLRMQRRARANTYIAGHPASPVSTTLVSDRAQMGEYEDVKKIYEQLAPSARQTAAGRMIAARLILLHRSALGQPILDFTQNDVKGKPVRFSAFKGKYVLVDFWASWCGPCRAENPNVLKAYNAYKNKNFTVIGISLDDNGGKWKKAISDDHMPWTELSDLKGWRNELAAWYGIQGIPSNLLVGPDGKIIAKDLRGAALHEKLAALLN